jgi:hypothetical protein
MISTHREYISVKLSENITIQHLFYNISLNLLTFIMSK